MMTKIVISSVVSLLVPCCQLSKVLILQ